MAILFRDWAMRVIAFSGRNKAARAGAAVAWLRPSCLWIIFLAFIASACAPQFQVAGPVVQTASLNADAAAMADGYVLPLRSWTPVGDPRAVILALHGFNDYANAFDEVARFWSFAGVAVYAYDQRGFGQSAGRGLWPGYETMAEDAVSVLRLLRARYAGRPLFLMGESMGGAVALLAAADYGAPTEGVILLAPAVWARTTMPLTHRLALWLSLRLLPGLQVTGSGLGIQASDNLEALRALGRDPLVIKGSRVDAVYGLVNLMDAAYDAAPRLRQRVAVLYGEQDQLVPPDPVADVYARLGTQEKTFYLYPNGWHLLLRDLGRFDPWHDILAFVLNESSGDKPSAHRCKAPPVLAESAMTCPRNNE